MKDRTLASLIPAKGGGGVVCVGVGGGELTVQAECHNNFIKMLFFRKHEVLWADSLTSLPPPPQTSMEMSQPITTSAPSRDTLHARLLHVI